MNGKKDWKYYLGLALLVYSFIPIFTLELLFLLPLSTAEKASLALIYIGSGEVAFIGAVALLGKPFVEAVKAKIKLATGAMPGRRSLLCRVYRKEWASSGKAPLFTSAQ